MGFFRVYSIVVVLLLLFATAISEDSSNGDIFISGIMLVPVLYVLAYGGG